MIIRDGALPIGKGQFIWFISRCGGGNVDTIIQMCLDAGLKWLSIKVANHTSLFEGSAHEKYQQQELLDELVPKAKAAGIGIHFWGYTYAERPGKETEPIIEMIVKHKPLSYTINAEHEYKNPGGAKAAIDHASAITWAMQVNDDVPNIPIGLSSYRWPSVHPEFPWNEFLRYCDFHNPQVYWQGADNPAEQLRRSVRELTKLRDLPVIPAGTMYPHKRWQPTPEQITEFLSECLILNLPAAHFWEWYYGATLYPELWAAMSDFDWPEVDQPHPPTPPEPPVEGNEIYNQALEDLTEKTIEAKDKLKRE